MPSFQGKKFIVIQPNTYNYPYDFQFTICSASGANDGFLPFGRTIDSVEVTAIKHDKDGTVDMELIENTTLNHPVVTVNLTYPSTNGRGRYKLRFVVTLDNGVKEEADYGRVLVYDR